MLRSVREIERRRRELGAPESFIERHVQELRRIRGHGGIPRVRLEWDGELQRYVKVPSYRRPAAPAKRYYIRASGAA